MRPALRASMGAVALLVLAGCFVPRDQDRTATDDRCTACHGSPSNPGDAVLRGAPPFDTKGNTEVAAAGVGAHQAHLFASATHAAVACGECHVVPTGASDEGHDDSDGPADVVFGPFATRDGGLAPSYDATAHTCRNTACHGPSTTSVWMAPRPSEQTCEACHGAPPPAPHPQLTTCGLCHMNLSADGGFVDAALHVNGVVEVNLPTGCVACHGSGVDPAPPQDTKGNTSTTAPGVGAHQAHLGASRARPVSCAECHRVPVEAQSPGHLDGVAQVVLSGVAVSYGGLGARYTPATSSCQVYCHDLASLDRDVGGSHHTPTWNRVDAGQAECGACHGLPPPFPHPTADGGVTTCGGCHPNMAADGTFDRPELHVDGRVTFILP